jgi:hypothetical protein
VVRDNISVNSSSFAAIDIPGDMIWRFLDSQGITMYWQKIVSFRDAL